MKPVSEIIGRERIDDLWGAGYTILPRLRDPFEIPPHLIPRGMSYQWNNSPDQPGWKPVAASRHDGWFAPAGYMDDIVVGGLYLCEKSSVEVAAAQAANQHAAQKQVDDWAAKYGGEFSGSVTVGSQTVLGKMDAVATTEIGTTKTIENTTAIPRELTPYIGMIFEERDRLGLEYAKGNGPSEVGMAYVAALEGDPNAAKWPTLNALLLPIAIYNIRKRLAAESQDTTQ